MRMDRGPFARGTTMVTEVKGGLTAVGRLEHQVLPHNDVGEEEEEYSGDAQGRGRTLV